MKIIKYNCPELEDMSPKGWTASKNKLPYLWISADRVVDERIQNFIQWASNANGHIWLAINKNIENYFDDELDCCVASDWNKPFNNTSIRTAIGEAEYQLKYCYPQVNINDKPANVYAQTLIESITDCLSYLPLGDISSVLVTSIPASSDKLNGLSWNMAEYISNVIKAKLLISALVSEKQQTKALSIQQKIDMWNGIYKNSGVVLSEKVKNKKLLIVDDLYQSGTSMWSFAKYLKSLGVTEVLGLAAVKSQRDSDNQ